MSHTEIIDGRTIKITEDGPNRLHSWICMADGCDGEMRAGCSSSGIGIVGVDYYHECSKCDRKETLSNAYYPRSKHDDFGSPIAGSRWFNQKPQITTKPLGKPVKFIWGCPLDGCDGQMIFNGSTWPTGDPGYHHTCDKCGLTAAIHSKRYPYNGFEGDE
jgi:hypothetical protein